MMKTTGHQVSVCILLDPCSSWNILAYMYSHMSHVSLILKLCDCDAWVQESLHNDKTKKRVFFFNFIRLVNDSITGNGLSTPWLRSLSKQHNHDNATGRVVLTSLLPNGSTWVECSETVRSVKVTFRGELVIFCFLMKRSIPVVMSASVIYTNVFLINFRF